MSSARGSRFTEKAPGFEQAAHYAVTLYLWSRVDSIYLEVFSFILALGFTLPSVEPVTDLPALKGRCPLRPGQSSRL